MEVVQIITESPGLILGVIGWAATASIILDASWMGPWQRRLLVVFTWMLWIVPAFDATVYQGSMAADVAITYCVAMTAVLVFVVSLSGFYKSSSKQ